MPYFSHNKLMVKNLAKKAMTSPSQRACYVIDHLIEALGQEPSSPIRRAIILLDIDCNPGARPTEIMERLRLDKSTVNRETDWMYNYGCILRGECDQDARAVRLETCGYAKRAIASALDYVDGDHKKLMRFLERFGDLLSQEKPTLRDAKIYSTVYERGTATKQQILDNLQKSSTSTNNRAIGKLYEDGVLKDGTGV